ncbi:hypothetical protein DFH09DRAFT_1095411 [Mycena vulgaris]|nr:hypothetical protein DFH09DRAFT_1095411 [Mycena vulgaris]
MPPESSSALVHASGCFLALDKYEDEALDETVNLQAPALVARLIPASAAKPTAGTATARSTPEAPQRSKWTATTLPPGAKPNTPKSQSTTRISILGGSPGRSSLTSWRTIFRQLIAILALQGLYQVRWIFTIHTDLCPLVWTRIWAWVQRLDTYRELVGAIIPFSETDAYDLYIRSIIKREFPTPVLSLTTPGVRVVVARAWLLLSVGRAQAPGLSAVVRFLHEDTESTHPANLAEYIEASGVNDFTSLVIRHIEWILASSVAVDRLFDLSGIFRILMSLVPSRSPVYAALLNKGIITAITNIIRHYSVSHSEQAGELLPQCFTLLERAFDTAPSFECQAIDWREDGHKDFCPRLRVQAGWFPAQEERFMQALIHHAYELNIDSWCAEEVGFMHAHPSESYYLFCDYTQSVPVLQVRSVRAEPPPDPNASPESAAQWEDQLARAARSCGRMQLLVALEANGTRSHRRMAPLRSATAEILEGLARIAAGMNVHSPPGRAIGTRGCEVSGRITELTEERRGRGDDRIEWMYL